jgi:glycerol kinase
MLPRVQASASHFGEVASSFVPELVGVPITGVLGDQQAALFGQACFREGMVKATYGTGAFVLANAGASVPSPLDGLLSTIAWDLGDHGTTTYAFEGSAFVAGAAIQWLRDELHFVERANQLGPLANSVLDSGGVTFVPAFTGLGSPFWNPDAHGVMMGLSVGTSRAHIARALVESLAFQVRAMTDAFVNGGVNLLELRADGGASSMNLLMELQATNSQVPVRRSTSLEATARGAACIAGLSVGIWSSLDDLENIWTSDYGVAPSDPTSVDAGYAAWLRSVERA